MTAILKFVYIMIICLFLLHVAAHEDSTFFYSLKFYYLFYTQSFISLLTQTILWFTL